MFAKPFQGPFKLVEQSRKRAGELREMLALFGKGLEIYFLRGPDIGNKASWYIQYSDTPPIEMSLTLRECINNLRVALDILISDSAMQLGKTGGESELKFPFGKDKVGLDAAFKRMKLPVDIEIIIRRIHPQTFPQNKWIRDLHDIDIISKHRTILPIFATVQTRTSVQLPADINNFIIQNIGMDFNQSTMRWPQGGRIMIPKDCDPRQGFRMTGQFDLEMPRELPFGGDSITTLIENLSANIDLLIGTFRKLFAVDVDRAERTEVRRLLGYQ